MKFSLERDTFAKVLKRIDGVCSSRGTFQVLSSCMIEARGDSIIVSGTDLDITLRVVEKASIQEEGVIIINARQLLDTVQNLPSDWEVLLITEGLQVLVEAGRFRARIPCGDVSEFPPIKAIEIKSSLTIDALTFKRLIDKTYFSISKDGSRAEFTGALMTISENGRVQMVSTDGHRLSIARATINIAGSLSKSFESGVIIPRKGLAELRNLIEGDITLDVVGSKLVVVAGTTTFYITMIAGNFPDFSKVIPAQLDHKVVLKRDSFQQILKRASIFTAKAGTIRISMSMGKLEVSTNDVKSGEMLDFVDAEYEGAGVTAGFNWRYIDEILSVIDAEMVSLEVVDRDSPALIRDVSDSNLDFIVMPMQI